MLAGSKLIARLALVLALLTGRAHAWWLFSGPTGEERPAAGGPYKAAAHFNMDDVRGHFKFSQANANEPTRVEFELTGLKGNNKLYHVHLRPVPKFQPEQVRGNVSALALLCGDPATGGHLNPHHVTQKLPPKSAPLDKYETGDLAGKHGPLSQPDPKEDRYVGAFTDDKLPMSGPNSIVGRSIVIHKNDGARWVCATIEAQA